ncbi:MAG: AAA domain-containing protein, partial [Halobacteria archaeon]|nr:AAA domain-containing protein [Halobacteria archaeon]
MRTVLVRGLDGEGPGDILGAFVGETEVEPDSVGDIEIEDGEATVEVPESEVDEVVETMDGNEVGGSEVSVVELDDEAEEIRNYVDEYTSLVELEREEEMRRHEQEIRSLSGEERESKGRSLLGMRGRDEGESLGGYEVKFVKGSGEELPEHEVSVGDLVMVSKQDPLRDDNPTGTVTEVTNHSITLSFDHEPQGFVFDGGLRLDLYVNDITYQRMKDALESLLDADGNLKRIRGILVGTREPEGGDDVAIEGWKNDDLNETQREAVRNALGTEDIRLVHGPPGTGKTTTAVEIIRQSVERGDDVLATAASNTAVDNVVELLVDGGADVVRVGHPARVTPSMRERTLDKVVQEKEKYRRSRELRDEAFEILDEQDGLTHPSGRWRRGLSDERIHELAEQGRGSRGVPPEKIQEMSEWLDLQEEADELFERSEKLEDEAVREVLEDADVVCTTNSTAGSRMMDGVQFDTLVID